MSLPRLLNVGYLHVRTLLADAMERASWAGEKAAKAAKVRWDTFERLMAGEDAGTEPDRASWGTGPSAEAAQHAMMML